MPLGTSQQAPEFPPDPASVSDLRRVDSLTGSHPATVLVVSRSRERREELSRLTEVVGARAITLSPTTPLPEATQCIGAVGWGGTSELHSLAALHVPRVCLVDRPRGRDVNLAASTGVVLLALLPDGFGHLQRFIRVALAGRLAAGRQRGYSLPPAPASLTPRQREVFRAIMSGMHRAAILDDLGISESTLEKHLAAIYRTTNEYSIAAVHAWGLQRPHAAGGEPLGSVFKAVAVAVADHVNVNDHVHVADHDRLRV